jgi:hypothetical protein
MKIEELKRQLDLGIEYLRSVSRGSGGRQEPQPRPVPPDKTDPESAEHSDPRVTA